MSDITLFIVVILVGLVCGSFLRLKWIIILSLLFLARVIYLLFFFSEGAYHFEGLGKGLLMVLLFPGLVAMWIIGLIKLVLNKRKTA